MQFALSPRSSNSHRFAEKGLRARRNLGLLVSLMLFGLYFAPAGLGQNTTGLPATAPLQNLGIDTVNQANLGVHISIPLINKAGRKMPFTFVLHYDNTTWTPVQNANGTWKWQPGVTLTLAGQPFLGTLGHSIGSSPCFYPTYSYTDNVGTVHPFGTLLLTNNTGGGGSTQVTVRSLDGSGYTLSVAYVSTGTTTSLFDESGNHIVPVAVSPGSITDPNGNVISTDGTNFTDTLGIQALTRAFQGSSSTYTYTGPQGTPETEPSVPRTSLP